MYGNEEFRANRSLLRDTMSPAFLNNVAAPAIHIAVSDWLQLWHEKIRLAQGRPFSADQDIVRGVVDAIFLVSLGTQLGLSKAQTELLSGFDKINLPAKLDTPTMFPMAEESRTYTEFRTLGNSLAIGLKTPWPRTTLNLALKVFPSLVSARRRTDKAISEVLRGAWERLSKGQRTADQAKCAADLMVLREAQLAKKQDRKFHYDTQTIRDELFGIYLSGQDSTSSTIRSAIKRLTEHQDVQRKLRLALRNAYPEAAETGRLPTAREIIETTVPYLDAFIEENHRLNPAVATVVRRATRDSIVLGHRIPKGTDVFMMLNGPSFQVPPLPVDEAARSGTSREAKDRYGVWKDEDVGQFMPERFLVKGENGKISFDPSAGPVLPYGSGLRGCFVTLIVWDFELRSIPPALSLFHGNEQQTYLRLAEV
ncbi:hypothetical protein SLS53_007427 [Cytospora paraplurivora]|uniref:Cytochrome P450 n=1 Tax=Cytospora paraplurivora TaxID=2898453 RepID=A0AAN9YDP8_9PEZI